MRVVEHFVVTVELWVCIKEPNTRFGKISSDCHFYCHQSFVGESVHLGGDGQDID